MALQSGHYLLLLGEDRVGVLQASGDGGRAMFTPEAFPLPIIGKSMARRLLNHRRFAVQPLEGQPAVGALAELTFSSIARTADGTTVADISHISFWPYDPTNPPTE